MAQCVSEMISVIVKKQRVSPTKCVSMEAHTSDRAQEEQQQPLSLNERLSECVLLKHVLKAEADCASDNSHSKKTRLESTLSLTFSEIHHSQSGHRQ